MALESVAAGDRLRVRPGAKIPVDGRIESGAGTMRDLDVLLDVANQMEGVTICALSDAAAIPTLSAVRLFKDALLECVKQKRDPIPYPRVEYAGAH